MLFACCMHSFLAQAMFLLQHRACHVCNACFCLQAASC
jgi:hypothetical protein